MELVTNTTRTHETHGDVLIEAIYRGYASYDEETGEGHVPGSWYVAYSPDGGEVHIDPAEDFIDAIST